VSFDFALLKACSHETSFEVALVEKDGTVRFSRPPSASRVSVYVDGIDVPPGGLFSHAELPFSRPGPYRIRAGVNDLLYVRTGDGAPRYLQVLPGPAVSPEDMATDLQRKLPELLVTASNRRVVLRSRTASARTAFAFPDPRWTDRTSSMPSTARILATAKELGISPGRYAYGRKVFPGWSVSTDPSSPDGVEKIIRFEYPVPNADPMIQLSYVTIAAFCRRCQGSRFEYDYSVVDGTYEEVRDLDLLSQEFDKFLFTRSGSHWKWPWLGSNILERVGGKGITDAVSSSALLNVDISNAFQLYKSIKTKQDQASPAQRVSDGEFPLSLAGIDIRPDPENPNVAYVTTTIVSRSRDPLSVSRQVGNPDPFTLFPESAQVFRLKG
jgi:hypothetical protein